MTEIFEVVDFDLESLQKQFPKRYKPLISFPNGITAQQIYDKTDPQFKWVFVWMCLKIIEV
jgi:hypothetical protein